MCPARIGMIKETPDWKIVGPEEEKIFAQEYRDSFICFLSLYDKAEANAMAS